jgi:hypothetical protein
MSKGRSAPGYERIAQNSKKGLEQADIYRLTLLNTSKLNIIAQDNDMGAVILVPGVPFILNAHPDYPFDINFTFSYLAEGEEQTLTATYIKSYGHSKK